LDDARAAYKVGINGTDNKGNPYNIRPILHIDDLGRKDSLSEFDPLVYQREILTFRDLPKGWVCIYIFIYFCHKINIFYLFYLFQTHQQTISKKCLKMLLV
jgi:hypothetical protein